jgi:hypothetical protein
MREKIALVFAIALLVTLMIVPASLAESSKKIPVVFTRFGPFFSQGDSWITNGDIYHVRETVVGFGTYSVTGVGVYLTGSSVDTGVGNLNLKNGVGHITYDSHLEFQDGTFEGTLSFSGTFTLVTETNPLPEPGAPIPALTPGPPSGTLIANNTIQKGIWHGTGQYQGWTLVLEYQTKDGATSLPLIGYLLVLPNFAAMPTPTPSPSELLRQQMRDAAMNYIEANHLETAQFMNDLSWTGGSANPLGFVGSVTYKYFSQEWTVTISYPVVPNPIYSISTVYSDFSRGVTYAINWAGTSQNGVITEISYSFTTQKPGM